MRAFAVDKLGAGEAGGDGAFRLHWIARSSDRDLDCWVAVPRRLNSAAPPLVAVHGVRRGARDQARLFASRAASQGRLVIAPLFDQARWPRYQQVVHKGRADLALFALLDRLRQTGLLSADQIELFGFSGGAQFAHRFAMFYPDHLTRLCVAAAGWWTFLDDAPFPYGLGAASDKCDSGARMRLRLDRFLRLPIAVAVGARDCVSDRNTRRGAAIDAQQGRSRLVRAGAWTAALEKAARRRGVKADMRFHILPDCGHSFRDCVRRGGLDGLVLPGDRQTECFHTAKSSASASGACLPLSPPALAAAS